MREDGTSKSDRNARESQEPLAVIEREKRGNTARGRIGVPSQGHGRCNGSSELRDRWSVRALAGSGERETNFCCELME